MGGSWLTDYLSTIIVQHSAGLLAAMEPEPEPRPAGPARPPAGVKRREAAAKIQAVQRGQRVRRKHGRPPTGSKPRAETPADDSGEAAVAATRIQAIQRGKKARKKKNRPLPWQREAAREAAAAAAAGGGGSMQPPPPPPRTPSWQNSGGSLQPLRTPSRQRSAAGGGGDGALAAASSADRSSDVWVPGSGTPRPGAPSEA